MQNRSFVTKMVFWMFLIFAFSFFFASISDSEGEIPNFHVATFLMGLVWMGMAFAVAIGLGNGKLENSDELSEHAVFTVVQSHHIDGKTEYVVRIKNMRDQELWVRFKEEPPKHFVVKKEKGKKVFLQFPTV